MKMGTVNINGKIFFYKGNLALLQKKIVAVIGKREVPAHVLEEAYNIGKYLAKIITLSLMELH